MKVSGRVWLGLLSALLAACAAKTPHIQSDYARQFDFKQLHAWDWAPQSATLETDAAAKTAERIQLDALVKSHIEQTLQQKGFRHAGGKPDFTVAWSFGEWQLDRHTNPNGGYGAVGLAFPGQHGSLLPNEKDGRVPPPSENPYTSKYEEAKLEVAIVDVASARVIWNATVTDDTDFGYFKASQRDRIGKAVDTLLSGFPPGMTGMAP